MIRSIIRDCEALAMNESVESQMPGRINGPADAYRHILMAAELTRRFGETAARYIMNDHEDTDPNQLPAERAMDLANNELGYQIGARASTWEDVVDEARISIQTGQPTVMTEGSWRRNPRDGDAPGAPRIPTRTPEGQFDPRLNWPNPSFPESPYLWNPTRPPLNGPIPPLNIHELAGWVVMGLVGGPQAVALQLFLDALTGIVFPRRDPLLLDLDGDGIEITRSGSGTYFDLGNDGFAELTGWVDPDDGLLTMDRNGDGIINNGTELFGDQTYLSNGSRATNGFAALEDLDSNADGRIDANDAAFSQLRVWQDEDGDGYSLPSELHTLEEVGIRSINLDSTITNVTDTNGNTENRVSSFERTDGTTSQIAEYSLDREPMYTIPEEWLDVPEDIAALPNLQGYGNVYDLHQAMVRDTSGELKSHVEQFASATDPDSRASLMEEILFEWTGAQSYISGTYLFRANNTMDDGGRKLKARRILGESVERSPEMCMKFARELSYPRPFSRNSLAPGAHYRC